MTEDRAICPGCAEYVDECTCAHYEPVLPFDTDDPIFAKGFEAGMTWAHLSEDDEGMTTMVHISNAEMMLRMAEAQGREVYSEEHDDTWATVHFGPAAASGEKR